eukprot:176612_1
MSCSTESLIPVWVTITVGSLMFTFLMATSIYSYTLLKRTSGWKNKGCTGKIKSWAADIWGRKSCYMPIISHLADTTTDFAAVAEFYIIANESSKKMCGGLNVWYLFGLSVSCMMIYRMISSYVIYTLTKSWMRVLTQFIDIELFRILYVSHKYKLSKSSSPQRLISTLEAVFEAAPQALIQFIFLMKTDGISVIIILSVILSLFNLTSSAVSDDKMLEGFTQSYDVPFKWKKKLKTMSLLYLFRFCDIASQILCLCLFWAFINGYALTIIISIDFIVILLFYRLTNKNTDALMGLVAMPLSFGENELTLFLFWFYRLLWVICVNITLWIYFPSYLSSDQHSKFVVGLWCFTSVGSIIKFPILSSFLKFIGKNWYRTSKERANMAALCEKRLYEDVMELMFYIHSSPKSSDIITTIDNKPYATLLWVIYKICDARKDFTLFNTMIENTGLDLCDKYEINNKQVLCDTALHAICSHSELDSEDKCNLVEKLLKICTLQYLKVLDHRGESLFMIMADRCRDEKELTICDLIWNKFNELSSNNNADKETVSRTRLIDDINEKKIEYLNIAWEGRHALQFAVLNSDIGHLFLKKFSSFYPTKQSKRDAVFRTDFPGGTLLMGCADHDNTNCFQILWKEMNDFCAEMNDGNEFKIKYLNVQGIDTISIMQGGHWENNALIKSLEKPDMSSMGGIWQLHAPKISEWFFRIIDLYPNSQSKREALQMKNKDGKDALKICEENDWNQSEKEKTMNKIRSILNGEEKSENAVMQTYFNKTDAIIRKMKKNRETHHAIQELLQLNAKITDNLESVV